MKLTQIFWYTYPLLVSGSSWLQNKKGPTLIEHILNTFAHTIFLTTNSYLSYAHIPANLYRVFGSTKTEKNITLYLWPVWEINCLTNTAHILMCPLVAPSLPYKQQLTVVITKYVRCLITFKKNWHHNICLTSHPPPLIFYYFAHISFFLLQ